MKVYISGITGTGMGPLALMAKQAGYEVCGSDLAKGAIYDELLQAGIEVKIGPQDGSFLKEKMEGGVDWFVYTSALEKDHPELRMAEWAKLKCSKRDEFTAHLVEKLGLLMVAVAGTHGKTTTTAMIVWASLRLGLPVSYIVGTTLGFAPSGAYHKGDKFFVYEADEYDRNFLRYHPWLAVITTVSYDHPDIYKTREDYVAAFRRFEKQSENAIGEVMLEEHLGRSGIKYHPEEFLLAGAARRKDASLAAEAVTQMIFEEAALEGKLIDPNLAGVVDTLNEFPGVGRRFEKIRDGLYSDYAHHPEEIAATVEIAREEAEMYGKKGVVVVYQPHQNTRQHEVRAGYKDAFVGTEKVFWLPTYLSRENPDLPVLTPEDLILSLDNRGVAEPAEISDALRAQIQKYLDDGFLVILMTAGPADAWIRREFGKAQES